MTNKTNKTNPLANFVFAILQFVIALTGASLVAWLLDNYVIASYRPDDSQGETIVLIAWVVFFVLLLFIVNRATRRIRNNG